MDNAQPIMKQDARLLDVLLKEYEIHRNFVTTYWTIIASGTTLILGTAGLGVSLAMASEPQRWWFCTVPPALMILFVFLVLMFRENLYANLYMARLERDINALVGSAPPGGPAGLAWMSSLGDEAMGVRSYAVVPALVAVGVMLLGSLAAYLASFWGTGIAAENAAFLSLFALCAGTCCGVGLWSVFNRSRVRDQVARSRPEGWRIAPRAHDRPLPDK